MAIEHADYTFDLCEEKEYILKSLEQLTPKKVKSVK